MAHGKDTSCRHDALVGDHHRSIMQRRVLEEDVLYQSLVDLGIYLLTRVHNVFQGHSSFDDNQRTNILLRHAHTCHHDRHNRLLVCLPLALLVGVEEPHEPSHSLLRTYLVKETADVLLKDDDEGYDTHAHQLVEYRTQQAHLQHLTHKEPDQHEDHDTNEDVEGA